MKKRWFDKKGMESEMIGWFAIGLGILIIVVLSYFVLKGKGSSALDVIKNIFKFGR